VNVIEAAEHKTVDLDLLDKKIRLVVEKMDKLVRENEVLKAQLKNAEAQNDEYAGQLEKLQEELDSSRELTRDVEKEEAIRKRIHGLLKKLEQL